MRQLFHKLIPFLFILTLTSKAQFADAAGAADGSIEAALGSKIKRPVEGDEHGTVKKSRVQEERFSAKTTAVIVVDVQPDFMTIGGKAGPLAVPGADEEYLAAVQHYVDAMRAKGYTIVHTQDWHPEGHSSFASTHGKEAKLPPETIELTRADGTKYNQEMWPVHCVQETDGAALLIKVVEGDIVQQKGTRTEYDSYSGFEDAGGIPTGLAAILRARGIENVIVLGLATDYCVQFTARDAVVKYDFGTAFVEGLSKGIVPGAGIPEMGTAGVVMLTADMVK